MNKYGYAQVGLSAVDENEPDAESKYFVNVDNACVHIAEWCRTVKKVFFKIFESKHRSNGLRFL